MAEGFIKVEIDDRAIREVLNRLMDQAGNIEPALADISEYLTDSTKQRFIDGQAPDGTAWKANTASTLAHKSGDKPLIGEGKALSTQFSGDITANTLLFGSPMEYAAVQQFGADKGSFTGGKSPWGDIPARPFLGISSKDNDAIMDIIRDHILTAMGK
jgi:phage virion morphogenesis protein